MEASSILMDFRSLCLLWWLCIGDSRWVACILNLCVCRNHGSSSSAFIWAVAVLLFLLCFLFLLVYHCVHLFVVVGMVFLRLVLRLLLVGSLFVGLIRGWGRVLVRSGGRFLVRSMGGCE